MVMAAAVDAGAIAVLDQLTEMALGESNKFDFTAVVTAMATAAAMQKIGSIDTINNSSPAIEQMANNLAINLTGGLLQSAAYDTLTGQTMYVDQIAAGALGSTLGQTVGNEIVAVVPKTCLPDQPAKPEQW